MKNVLLVCLSLEKKLETMEINSSNCLNSRMMVHLTIQVKCMSRHPLQQKMMYLRSFQPFYATPEKPAAVDCGVPLPFLSFFVDEPPNPIPFPMVPSKMITKPAFDCCVPFFPVDFSINLLLFNCLLQSRAPFEAS